jgi:predicted alpha/beta superfamily hydrolase
MTARQIYFPPIETHLLPSRHIDQTFRIQVMRPFQDRHERRRFPVVYLTDGNALFDVCKGMAALIQTFKPDSPPFMLVAIGYPSDSPVAGELLRGRDLTFEGCPDFFTGFELFREWQDVLHPQPGTRQFGAADSFQRFVGEELFPFIETRYEAAPGERTYFGHSVGGAFGLFTLFTRPALFSNYIVSSPTVTYCGTTPSGVRYDNHDFLIDRARRFIAAGQPLCGKSVYVSVGTEEEYEPQLLNWRFTSGFYRMVGVLKDATALGLKLTAEALPGETHATACPIAFSHGLRAVL